MIKLADRLKADHVRITSTYVDTRKDDKGWMHHAYRITLRRKGRQWTLDFRTGVNNGDPELLDVMYCILSDTFGYENASGFADWAGEYGYDPDSIKARDTYNAVKAQAKRLERFLRTTREFTDYLENTDWQI